MSGRAALIVALSLPLLAACGGSDGGGSSAPSSPVEFGEKDLETATAAMQEYTDRYISDDFAGAYELASKSTREAYSVEEFTKIQDACYKGEGMPVDVEGVRLSGDQATVRLVVGGFKQSRTMVYEDGSWRAKPAPETDLTLPVDEAVAECEKDG